MTFRHSVAFTLTVPLLCALLSAQTHKEKADLLISGGTVVTMDASRAILCLSLERVNRRNQVSGPPCREVESDYRT